MKEKRVTKVLLEDHKMRVFSKNTIIFYMALAIIYLSINIVVIVPKNRNLIRELRCQESAFTFFDTIVGNERFRCIIADLSKDVKEGEMIPVPSSNINRLTTEGDLTDGSISIVEASIAKSEVYTVYMALNVDNFLVVSIDWHFTRDEMVDFQNAAPRNWLFDRPELYYLDKNGYYKQAKWGNTIDVSTRLL